MAGKCPNPDFEKGNWYGECPREVNRWKYDVPGVGMRMIPSL
jgi:hypothetical protein